MFANTCNVVLSIQSPDLMCIVFSMKNSHYVEAFFGAASLYVLKILLALLALLLEDVLYQPVKNGQL